MTPLEWDNVELGSLIGSVESGTSVNCENRPVEAGEIGVLKTSSVSYGVFNPKEHKAVLEGEQDGVSVNPRRDTIIICRSNTPELVGASAYIDQDYEWLYLPDTLWLLGPRDSSFSVRWLGYLLNSNHMRTQIKLIAQGTSSNMKKITKPNLLRLEIPLPPLPEQRRIAEILGTWDEAITLTERLIEALQARKRRLLQVLLTGEVRFPEFKQLDWHEVQLGDLFTERRETGFIDLPLVAITNDQGIVYRDTLAKRDTSNEDKSNYLRICPGDIGYNTMRMWQGVSGVSRIEGIVSPAYTICTPHEDVDAHFMGYLFKLPEMVYQFWRYSQGLVDDTLSLKFPNFSLIKVSIPELPEQARIADVLQLCDSEIELLQNYRERLAGQKRGLMQQLLTGQIRVGSGNTVG